ncbi:MAG: replication-associated recombination protein A [Ruminococcaceae bacterium]|nr:replication-associated recombination protein A [Oscillospiraceae bacterium]
MRPLADRIRPTELAQVCGQQHILGENMPLRNIIEGGNIPNMIFYGPSGIGKTTVAEIIAAKTNKRLHKLNGTMASTKDIKEIVDELDTMLAPDGVLLYLDEIQYFNKRQQQSLLQYMENGTITLIASTTENPYFYVYSAILSRATVFEFKPLSAADVEPVIHRGFAVLGEESGTEVQCEKSVIETIARGCGGDVRKALNAAENCFLASAKIAGKCEITLETARALAQKSAMRYDKDGDEHYDILSAYQKSMRGSDPQAALHYLARLLEAGDLPGACRRLAVCASEDVGLAYPQIIPIVKAAVDTALQVGLPEARIPLADAVILVATSPKSNAGAMAIDAALADIRAGNIGPIPRQLQNKHYDGEGDVPKGQNYLYPHAFPNHWVQQQYLPDVLKDAVYYQPCDNKMEQAAVEYWKKIKK